MRTIDGSQLTDCLVEFHMKRTEKKVDIWHYATTLLLQTNQQNKISKRQNWEYFSICISAVSASKDYSRPVWETLFMCNAPSCWGTLLIPHNELADGDCQHDWIIPAEQTVCDELCRLLLLLILKAWKVAARNKRGLFTFSLCNLEYLMFTRMEQHLLVLSHKWKKLFSFSGVFELYPCQPVWADGYRYMWGIKWTSGKIRGNCSNDLTAKQKKFL